jgi:hypothetical protein
MHTGGGIWQAFGYNERSGQREVSSLTGVRRWQGSLRFGILRRLGRMGLFT